jgi:hypothetical protein
MLRSPSTQALLVAMLTALASFCALQASAGQPAARRYSIVAQSNKATATTGRQPLAQRIAASNLPLLLPAPAREGCGEHGCPVPGAASIPLPVESPLADDASGEPAQLEALSDTDDPEAAAEADAVTAEPLEEAATDEEAVVAAEPATEPTVAADSLLERVKTALAAKRQPAAEPDTAADRPLAGVPARLELDVRESRSLVKEGEQVVVRMAVRNVGGEPAADVSATLFFADGIEPLQAIGHEAEVYPGEVRFDTVKEIQPGDSVDLLVTAIGTRAGNVTYRGELKCSQLGGRIAREGAVTVRPRKAAAE